MRSPAARVLVSLVVSLLIFTPLLEGIPLVNPEAFGPAAAVFGIAAVLGGIATLRVLAAPTQHPVLARVLVGLVSVTLSLTALDLLARLAFPYGLSPSPYNALSMLWPTMPFVDRYRANLHYEGDLVGDLSLMSPNRDHRVWRHVTLPIDAYGFINPDDPADAADIILLGDSFGAGTGTDYPDTLGALLEEPYGLEVYNLSVNPASAWQEYANYLIEGERIPTKRGTIVVWTLFTGNDLDEVFAELYTTEDLPWSNRQAAAVFAWRNYVMRSPLRLALARVISRRPATLPVEVVEASDAKPLLLYREYRQTGQRNLYEIRQHPNYTKLRQTIQVMHELTQERGVQLVIVVIPTKEELYAASQSDSPQQRSGFGLALEAIASEEGIPFLDLRPSFMQASPKAAEDLYWRDDSHWNAAGHRVAAETLMDFLCTPPVRLPAEPCADR